MNAANRGHTVGYNSPIATLTPDERRVFVRAQVACERFTQGRRASLEVRMAFWEIEDGQR